MLFIILAFVYGIGVAVAFLGYLFSWDHDTHPLAAAFLALIWPVVLTLLVLLLGYETVSRKRET